MKLTCPMCKNEVEVDPDTFTGSCSCNECGAVIRPPDDPETGGNEPRIKPLGDGKMTSGRDGGEGTLTASFIRHDLVSPELVEEHRSGNVDAGHVEALPEVDHGPSHPLQREDTPPPMVGMTRLGHKTKSTPAVTAEDLAAAESSGEGPHIRKLGKDKAPPDEAHPDGEGEEKKHLTVDHSGKPIQGRTSGTKRAAVEEGEQSDTGTEQEKPNKGLLGKLDRLFNG